MTAVTSASQPDDYEAFREEVRAFALENCPEDVRRTVASGARIGRHEYSTWQKILFRKAQEPAFSTRTGLPASQAPMSSTAWP
jgi:hypothetical protein